jgi:serine/threonine protein kinase
LKQYISEKKHLKMAFELGVPCPKILENLSKTDMIYEETKFHLLVMNYHQQDEVDACDVICYAKSLLTAVAKLHENAWNSKTKEVVLLDFGLAQMQAGAKWYRSTKHYEAPEITKVTSPHSCCTDAFSVGKTLLSVCDSTGAPTRCHITSVNEASLQSNHIVSSIEKFGFGCGRSQRLFH